MNRRTALIWSWLGILTKPRYDAVMEVFGNLEEGLMRLDQQFLKGLGCREETVRTTLLRLEEFDPEKYEEKLQKRDIHFLTIEDPEYPAALKEIGDPPVFLYYKGSLGILDQPCIGLVGTREMSAYGKRVAEALTGDFIRAGMVTVSGLAIGIDATVATESILAGGKTVAVLGHGLAMIYPQSNAKIAQKILSHGGLILSEFPLDMQPGKFTFPARNRIIAGLTLGTVVLEAPRGSGSIITAELALEYGRDVFVVPGQIFDPNYEGSHDLITKGQGKLVSTAKEVLQELGIVAPEKRNTAAFQSASVEEQKVYDALTSMPQKIDDLVERAGLDSALITATLTILELAGAAKKIEGGLWIRN